LKVVILGLQDLKTASFLPFPEALEDGADRTVVSSILALPRRI